MSTLLDTIARYQATAPVDVDGLLRELKIPLEKTVDLPADVLGQITALPNDQYKITINKKDHYFRQRFTMAHELGHLLMHRHLLNNGTNDDKAYRSTDRAAFYNPNIRSAQETQANQFAANLLMPAELVRSEWERLGPGLKAMAKAFQVSPAAMRIRLQGIFGMNVHLVEE